jgi:hypothetical protein
MPLLRSAKERIAVKASETFACDVVDHPLSSEDNQRRKAVAGHCKVRPINVLSKEPNAEVVLFVWLT